MKQQLGKSTSLKSKWIVSISFAILFAIGVTVVFNHLTVKRILTEDHSLNTETDAHNAANQVVLGLATYENALQQLGQVVTTLVEKENGMAEIDTIVKKIHDENDDYLAVYFMDFTNGNLHMTPQIDYDWDARDSQTYSILQADPQLKWMDVYLDTGINKLMTTVIAPVERNGQLIGAVGFDLGFSSIGAIRQQIEENSNANLIVLDPQGLVVSSFLDEADGTNINPNLSGQVEGVTDYVTNKEEFENNYAWVPALYETDHNTVENFDVADVTYSGQAITIDKHGWKVISLTDNQLFEKKMSSFTKVAIISIIFGLIIGVIVAIVLANNLIKIIRQFQTVIKKTASGDLVTQFDVKSNDEIGQLHESYNTMLEQIRHLIQEVNGNVEQIQQASDSLAVIAVENNEALHEVSNAIEEIAASSNNQSEKMQDGSLALLSLATEIEQVQTKTKLIDSEAHDALEQVQTGFDKVHELQASYSNLEDAFAQVTQMTKQLDEKSKSISNVTDVIAQITDQTNLLALNASIEAARAGEHGKGFAVVADEVRKLAEGSKKATVDIQLIISSILHETIELVLVIEKTNAISTEQKHAVTTVHEAIEGLSTSLTAMSSTVQQTTSSMEHMNQQKDYVVTMIETVSTISNEVTASTQEMASSVEEQTSSTAELAEHTKYLHEQVNDLNKAVNKFKI